MMSQTTTGTDTLATSRTAKRASPSKAESQFPQFEMATMKIPEAVRDAAAQWINQSKENFEKAINATEEVNGTFESAFSIAAKGAVNCGAKFTEATRTNTVAAFDIANALMAAQSLPEMIEITTTSSRKQFDTLASQNQELWALTQQLVTETVKPLAGRLPKVFSPSVSS
jgi:phasin